MLIVSKQQDALRRD